MREKNQQEVLTVGQKRPKVELFIVKEEEEEEVEVGGGDGGKKLVETHPLFGRDIQRAGAIVAVTAVTAVTAAVAKVTSESFGDRIADRIGEEVVIVSTGGGSSSCGVRIEC
ncbi:hypothetical protein HZH68_004788 [Vespula germanica]|uniref:Uncharacterized protein n=1 Tax=Vespula germanica TaxID=30212 RepID=A0A834KPK3_VESGE|nr:hypothetical protein HZH68_004788 [Vespula germanica]